MGLDFGKALEAMKEGKKVRRRCWSKETFISLQHPDETHPITSSFFYIGNDDDFLAPWVIPPDCVLAEDWIVCGEEDKKALIGVISLRGFKVLLEVPNEVNILDTRIVEDKVYLEVDKPFCNGTMKAYDIKE